MTGRRFKFVLLVRYYNGAPTRILFSLEPPGEMRFSPSTLNQRRAAIRKLATEAQLSGFAVQVVQAPGFSAQPPSGLFDGMIAPIVPFAISGAAWYQGEDNASRAYQYLERLPALIQGWRGAKAIFHS